MALHIMKSSTKDDIFDKESPFYLDILLSFCYTFLVQSSPYYNNRCLVLEEFSKPIHHILLVFHQRVNVAIQRNGRRFMTKYLR